MTAERPGIWKRRHHLDRMSFRELVAAYFQYYTIQTYLALSVLCVGVAIYAPPSLLGGLAAVAVVTVCYPLTYYLIHRFIQHGSWMYKSPLFARDWKRIHYDHHQDPNHLEVLFGTLHHELPPVALITLPVGYALGGIGGAALAFACGLLTTCAYEFVHCVQHLSYKPKAKWLADMKARHMAHHFHDETGNFSITDFTFDRVFGTFYERAARPKKSRTVFNLGYTDEVAQRYPWVKNLSGGVATGHPRKRGA